MGMGWGRRRDMETVGRGRDGNVIFNRRSRRKRRGKKGGWNRQFGVLTILHSSVKSEKSVVNARFRSLRNALSHG